MSLRARLLSYAVRRRVRPQMQGAIDVGAMRRSMERLGVSPPRGVECVAVRHGGVAGERVRALAGPSARPRLFYIHGGGFISCSPRTHRSITGAFARRGFDVFAVDYRLAPEHRFPAALDDVASAWRAFAEAGPAIVAGDSAGANLAMALMLKARDAGWVLPRAAALLSPPVDLVGTGGSLQSNAARDPMFEVAALRQFVAFYLGDADPAHPYASPLNGDLAGLPPLLMHVGETELLRDDSLRLAAKARAAGIDVSLRVFPDVPHVWQWADRVLPEARRSLDEMAAFLRRHGASGP